MNLYSLASGPIGSISELYGEVKIKRQGQSVEAKTSGSIYINDNIKTGEDSLVKIVFVDRTSIEIAPDSTLRIDEFVFNPEERKSLFNVIKGKIKSEISKTTSANSTVEYRTRNA